MPSFDQLFQLVCSDDGLPRQLGRGSFGAVFVCTLRPEARAVVEGMRPPLLTDALRALLTAPGAIFACKYVVLPDAEASAIYDKEVSAALQLNTAILGGPWEPLMRATLNSTLLGWHDDLYDPAVNPATGTRDRATMPWVEKDRPGVVQHKPARLVRTLMELNQSSIPAAAAGGVAALPVFCNMRTRLDGTTEPEPRANQTRMVAFRDEALGGFTVREIPNVRKAVRELAGIGDLFGAARPLADARLMAAQVLLGLHTLHSNGRIHRDIKPENVLAWAQAATPGRPVPVHMAPWVKITDFGMLRVDDADFKTLAVGSAAYNPPELSLRLAFPMQQADGSKKEVVAYNGEAFDVFSAGCMLYALLVGHAPQGPVTTGWPHRFAGGAVVPDVSAHPLLEGLCAARQEDRFTLTRALQDPFFTGVLVPAALWPPGFPIPAAGAPGIRPDGPVPAAPAAPAAAAVGGAGAAP